LQILRAIAELNALETIVSKLYNPFPNENGGCRDCTSKEQIMDKKTPVVVRVPQNMTLEQAQHTLATVLNKVGHPTCYSGFNINFVNAGDPGPMILKAEGGKLIEG
jgi:hypothetical protein